MAAKQFRPLTFWRCVGVAADDGPKTRRLVAKARAFCSDEVGIILPYVTVMITVIVGVSVLALDGARYESLQTQMQKGADALALAGAAELDGFATAITRANAAMKNTGSGGPNWVVNSNLFGSNVAVTTGIRFFSSLPAGTTTSIASSYVTADAHLAKYVEVTVTPATMSTILPASFFGGANSVTTGAVAVAGHSQVVCGPTAMFICNPYETAGMTYSQATDALVAAGSSAASMRKLVSLHASAGSFYSPGNYGYVYPATGTVSAGSCGNPQVTAQALAQVNPNICVSQSSVNFRTGVDQPVRDAINVRWDLFSQSFTNCKNDTTGTYPPDVNVRKGMIPGSGSAITKICNEAKAATWPPGITGTNPSNANVGLPLDNTMLTAGIPNGTVQVGDGSWVCGDIVQATSASTASGGTVLTFAAGATTGIFVGMGISGPVGSHVPSNATVTAVAATTVTMSAGASGGVIASGTSITVAGYWSTAHPAALGHAAPPGCSGTPYASITRYSVYKYENSSSYANDASAGGEKGATYCNQTPPAADRRLLNLAFINCLSVSGASSPNPVTLNGSANNVPVAAFGEFFLTLPAPNNGDEPFGEFAGFLPSGSNNFQNAQLYR